MRFGLTNPRAAMVRADMRTVIPLDTMTTDTMVVDIVGVGIDEGNLANFSVGQNQPNPFGYNSVINYELNSTANVTIHFTDVSGKNIETISNGNQLAGNYTLNADGNKFADGTYFYTFIIDDQRITKRMVIAKE